MSSNRQTHRDTPDRGLRADGRSCGRAGSALVALALLATACTTSGYVQPQVQQDARVWIDLFNGNDLDGWIAVLDGGTSWHDGWNIENGVLSSKGTHRGYIRTKEGFADYELELEWRIPDPAGAQSALLLGLGREDQIWPDAGARFEFEASDPVGWTLSSYTVRDGAVSSPAGDEDLPLRIDADERTPIGLLTDGGIVQFRRIALRFLDDEATEN